MPSASWIVGNDVATIWMSRMAMNIPMHMLAKPSQVRAITNAARSGSMVGEWLINGRGRGRGWDWSLPGEIPQPGERPILRADADYQDREIRHREDQSIPRQAKAEWQGSDLADDDEIVRVRHEPVGTGCHERHARQHDDTRGPTASERCQNPNPYTLQRQQDRQPDKDELSRPAEQPQARKPKRMQQDDHLVMPGRDLMRTVCQQGRGVAAVEPEFAQSLRRDGSQQKNGRRHAAFCSETQLAVKPGPIAVNSVRDGSPPRMTRSRTNSAVGADMLPYSARMARSWSKVPCSSAKARSSAMTILLPPGWNASRSMSSSPNPERPRIPATAGAMFASANGGIARSKMT